MTVNRKERILDAAAQSFSLFGYKATTMDQVAKIANVGKGTIYTFFSNKEELFYEIISRLINEMKRVAERALNSQQSFSEKIHHILYNVLEFRKEHQLFIKLTQEMKAIGTPEATEAFARVEAAILNFIKTFIDEGKANNELKPCDSETTAFVILKWYTSIVFDWEQNHQPLEKKQIADLFQLYMMDGLANNGQKT